MDRHAEGHPRPIELQQLLSKRLRVMGGPTAWVLPGSIAVVVTAPRLARAQHAHGT